MCWHKKWVPQLYLLTLWPLSEIHVITQLSDFQGGTPSSFPWHRKTDAAEGQNRHLFITPWENSDRLCLEIHSLQSQPLKLSCWCFLKALALNAHLKHTSRSQNHVAQLYPRSASSPFTPQFDSAASCLSIKPFANSLLLFLYLFSFSCLPDLTECLSHWPYPYYLRKALERCRFTRIHWANRRSDLRWSAHSNTPCLRSAFQTWDLLSSTISPLYSYSPTTGGESLHSVPPDQKQLVPSSALG